MVKVIVEGWEFYLDANVKKNLDQVKKVVNEKDFDYVAPVVGTPGTGKSTFTQVLAKYCCSWFDGSYIAFNSEEFIDITNKCKKGSAVILDESFQSLNTKAGLSLDFMRIINHLQLIRQKNLFIFLCLPNFFDLQKGIAIYRTHHLFVCYSPKYGERGHFAAYNREAKKNLYIIGKKYMNYNSVKPNFRGRFTKARVLDWEAYEKRKAQHLREQDAHDLYSKVHSRDLLIHHLVRKEGWKQSKIVEICRLSPRTIRLSLQKVGTQRL